MCVCIIYTLYIYTHTHTHTENLPKIQTSEISTILICLNFIFIQTFQLTHFSTILVEDLLCSEDSAMNKTVKIPVLLWLQFSEALVVIVRIKNIYILHTTSQILSPMNKMKKERKVRKHLGKWFQFKCVLKKSTLVRQANWQ